MFFKKKKPQKTVERFNTKFDPLPVIETPALSIRAEDENGHIIELRYHSIMESGKCLIRDNSDLYHTYVGCMGIRSGYKIRTIQWAKENGYCQCYDCFLKIEEVYDD